jgi:hypothetical protein
MPKKAPTSKDQHTTFKKAARALECDESEASFDKALKKLAKAKSVPPKK